MPRFILFVKSNYDDPNPEIFAAVAKFNEEMKSAGVLLGGEGIAKPDDAAYQLTYSPDGEPAVEKGPFAEASAYSQVTGYWLIKTETVEDALEWAKKVPFKAGKVEMRKIMEAC
jgi:hypothetical protein